MNFVNKTFTLIETIIVVAIIAVLCSILIPSLSNAREKTKSAVCKSNQRQIGVASIMWSDKNDGKTLAAAWYTDIWNTSLTPFTDETAAMTQQSLSGVYHCPSLNTADLADTFVADYRFTSYATNQLTTNYFGGEASPYWGNSGGTRLSQISLAERKVSFMDSTHYQIGVSNYHPTGTANKNCYNRWHLPKKGLYGKANILWYDGHVTIQPGDFTRNDW